MLLLVAMVASSALIIALCWKVYNSPAGRRHEAYRDAYLKCRRMGYTREESKHFALEWLAAQVEEGTIP